MTIGATGAQSGDAEMGAGAGTGASALADWTLGPRLAAQARRIALRHAPTPGWLPSLLQVIDRIADRPVPDALRFRRVEPPVTADLVRVLPRPGPKDEPGAALPPTVRDRLQTVVGPGVDAVRIHQGDSADALAKAHRAEAVAIGRDVSFREGRYRPDTIDGFALLAHEATHVVQVMRPGASWRRATEAGAAREEREALGREQTARQGPARSPLVTPTLGVPDLFSSAGRTPSTLPSLPTANRSPVGPSSPSPAPVSGAVPPGPTTAALRPMRADERRSEGEAASMAVAAVDPGQIRQAMIRELLGQVRTNYERGA